MPEYRIVGTLESLDDVSFELWEAGCLGLEERGDSVVAHFATRTDLNFGGTWFDDVNTDWLEQYRQSLQVMRVGRVVVVPNWRDEVSRVQNEFDIEILLEPGLAFGTGQHETTRMAMSALQRQDLKNKTVLDVGAGSGILAIVAAKLGAQAFGIDNDAQTVQVAQDNAAQNHVNASFFAGVLEDVDKFVDKKFDVVIANLFAELHAALMQQYKAKLAPGGVLVVTGIMAGTGQADEGERMNWQETPGRELLVLDALRKFGFEVLCREQLGDWILFEARAS